MTYYMRVLLIVSAFALLVSVSSAHSQTVDQFYRGRTLTIVVGNSAGGGYDLNARLLARHMSRHLPGQPTIVVQNRPGAASLNAANYVYKVAPKDGSVIGIVARIALIEPLFTKQEFEGTKFYWLGSISKDISTCIAWHNSPVKTWNDLLTKEFTAAGQGVGADPDTYAQMIKSLFGAKIKLVTGYPGTAEQAIAMERGEVDGYCGISYSTLKARHKTWLAEKLINILVQNALEREPELGNVPLITDFVKDDERLAILKLIVGTQSMARPFFAPPGIPDDRAVALRKAFEATISDPEFLAAAVKIGVDVSPMRGEAIHQLLTDLYATPKDIVAKAARVMAGVP